jgi:glycosyltransferase involved in cell wall biosynthesis
MKILMAVPHTLPAPDGGHGCPVMSWAMLKWLKESGHDVSLFAFSPTESSREPGRMKARGHLKSLSVPLFETEPSAYLSRLPAWRLRLLTARKIIAPRTGDYRVESARCKTQWRQCVEHVQPDAFLLYTTDAVALAEGTFPEIPRLASLVDLDHEARELKRALRPRSFRNRLKNFAERLQDRLLPQATIKLLTSCDVVVEHSAASSRWLNQQGVPAHYLPNPVASQPLPDDWRAVRELYLAQASVKRILMVGYLRGVATQNGLHLLADEVLPALARKPGRENWEVHVVGGGELTPELKAKLSHHPKVRLRGFVENLSEEYRRAHLTLVAVREKLGFRTRLVEAFAHALPCVVHSNNLNGMPELEHKHNSLLADTGEGLAEAITQILRDDALRLRLEVNARKTYDEKLSVPVVMSKMYGMLEAQVAGALRNTPDPQPVKVNPGLPVGA